MMKNKYTYGFLFIFIVALVVRGITNFDSLQPKADQGPGNYQENEAATENSVSQSSTVTKAPGIGPADISSADADEEEVGDTEEDTDENDTAKLMEKVSKKDDAQKKKGKDPIDLEKMFSMIDEKFESELEKALLKEGLKTYEENSYLPSNISPVGSGGGDPLEGKKGETKVTSQNHVSNPNTNYNPNNHHQDEQIDLAVYAIASKDQSSFVANEDPIELYFEAYNKDTRIPAQVKADVYNEDKELVTTLAYREVSPLKYVTTFENPYEFTNTPEGKYFVKIEATARTQKSQASQKINMIESFSINSKKTRFGGSVNDTLNAKGNLQINVSYRVYVSGTYLIQASLYDNAGKIIAFYEEPMHLDRASQVSVPLEFHGYFFYQRKLNGPFNLKNISLSYVNSNLTNEVGGINSPNHITKNYQWTDFNQNPYENTEVRDKIKSIDSYLNSILASN